MALVRPASQKVKSKFSSLGIVTAPFTAPDIPHAIAITTTDLKFDTNMLILLLLRDCFWQFATATGASAYRGQNFPQFFEIGERLLDASSGIFGDPRQSVIALPVNAHDEATRVRSTPRHLPSCRYSQA